MKGGNSSERPYEPRPFRSLALRPLFHGGHSRFQAGDPLPNVRLHASAYNLFDEGENEAMTLLVQPPPSIWNDRRGEIHAALEEAAGQSISVNDTHADTLIASAQALGMLPHELRIWIADSSARPAWSAESLMSFARRYGFARESLKDE